MTSRRPMIRTYSGNGRTSSFSEEEGSSSNGRSESRNTYLSNVRPENSYSRYSHYRPTRSTLCSVMAQLTEDVQPSFETTLKSKAVSENCNVRFSCVVSGYPAPELKWYKDDMEMDRYCGLPKYEIRRNGKTHTLHIYNCTLDDAAIYQVSASNGKGIVSCSGVLEVGTMNEYKIHQRFFAKLKQKAEKKKNDLEVQAKKEDKENIQKERQQSTPEPPPRKRHVPPPEETPAVKDPEAVGQQGAAVEPNGVSSEVKETTPVTTKNREMDREVSLSEENLVKKKIKISNGVDAGVSSSSNSSKSHTIGNGNENCYDGGMSLAQFLAETIQSQTEEKQNLTQEDKSEELDVLILSASKEQDTEPEHLKKESKKQENSQQEAYDRQKRRGKELAMEKEGEKTKQLVMPHTVPSIKHNSEVKHHSQAHKDHDQVDIFTSSACKDQKKEQEHLKKECEEQEKAQQEMYERQKRNEEELAEEKDKQLVVPQTVPSIKHISEVKHHSKAHKDHDHHNIQTSITSMLHTFKDFLFGKSKKDSHDHMENKEREFEPSPVLMHPPQPDMPPSFQLNLGYNQVSELLRENVVPMEMDKPEDPSEFMDADKMSASLELHINKNKDSVVHTDLTSTHQLLPESLEESMGLSVKEAENTVEFMEVSVRPEDSNPGAGRPLSGLKVPTETDTQVVSVVKEVPIQQQVPHCLVVSTPSSPREDIAVMPQTQATSEDKSSPTPTPTPTLASLEESWTLPHSVISTSESQSLGEAPTETLQEEEVAVDTMVKEVEPDMAQNHSSNQFCNEEKAEVKSIKQPPSDINRYEISSAEEKVESHESKAAYQVLLPVSTVAAFNVEKEHVKEEAKHSSLMQEMTMKFPPTAAPDSLERGDLKMLPECTFSKLEKSTEVNNFSAISSLSSGSERSDDKSVLTEQWISALVKDLDSNLYNYQKTQEVAAIEGEHNEAMDDSLQLEVEEEKKEGAEVEESDELNNLSVTRNKDGDATVSEEDSNVAQQDNSVIQLCWPSEVFQKIPVSTTENVTDIEPNVPDVNAKEHFIIPKIEIMEPELKEYTLPLTILASNKQESESAILQKHNVTHVPAVIIKDQRMADSPSLLPTQKSMQNDSNLSPTEKVKEVVQLNEKTEMFEWGQPEEISNVELPPMDFTSVPVISVSCTDKKEDDVHVDTLVSDTPETVKTPTVPFFVVPPISVTTHESDSAFRLFSESVETKTLAATQRGTKYNAFNNMTINPEKTQSSKQNPEEMVKSTKENTLMLYEAPIPKTCDNEPSFSKTADNIVPEISHKKSLQEAKGENVMSSVERLLSKPPTHPSLSPASLRKFMSKAPPESDSEAVASVPVITVGGHQSDKADDELSGGSTPTSSLSCESSPRLKRRDSLSLIRSATPEELASGARRKIFIPKPKEDGEGVVVGALDTQGKKETPYMSPSQARRVALLQTPSGQNTPPMERRSPLLNRRKVTLEVPKVMEETSTEEPVSTKQEEKPPEKKFDPLKAPQVIRKIRGEPFPDASGHLKLWCQFFNVLSDSTIKWYRDEKEILQVKRSGGDESQVALAIVLASSQDCGVYGCSITNEYGTDTTDFLLSEDILSGILLKDDLEVGEEIEMTPLLFAKGLADSGSWGEKYFGRIMTETVHIGEGCAHKASRVRVIYGLDPIFESGSTCIIKVQNPIAYGTKQESNLAERNGEITKQECKVQNMIREYCKIFAAEARVIENFGYSLEVIPQYLMYRPANSVPYATVEADLKGVFLKYCKMDPKGRLDTQTVSEVEQKCSTFQHWIHQWTHGNLLVTQLEGVETKITNVRVVTKSKGYQGLTECGSPEVFEQFLTQHHCNYYCGLLGLKPLKTMESLQQSTKMKGSRSPLLNRKSGSSSPQLHRKGQSPQMPRKANSSPKVTKKVQETEDNKSSAKSRPAETADVIEIR